MDKILFFDPSNDGHHYIYNQTVMTGTKKLKKHLNIYYYSSNMSYQKEEKLIELGIQPILLPIKYQDTLQRIIILLKLFLYAKKHNFKQIHFLYLDNIILALMLLFPFLSLFNISATLHWFPNRKTKQQILKFLLEKHLINKLVVHGDFTKEKIDQLAKTKGKIMSIVYPNLHVEKSNIKTIDSIKEKIKKFNGPFLLVFGGLRHDKGIDILLEALSNVKEQYTLLIAGKEEYFTKQEIKHLLNKYKIENRVLMDIRFISDEELDAYFTLTDLVLLPYRSYFMGQSGPLTEGVKRSKVIIGPNSGEIGHTIEYYQLGYTFEAENVVDLSNVIRKTIINLEEIKNNIKSNQEIYKSLLSVESFVECYQEIFEDMS